MRRIVPLMMFVAFLLTACGSASKPAESAASSAGASASAPSSSTSSATPEATETTAPTAPASPTNQSGPSLDKRYATLLNDGANGSNGGLGTSSHAREFCSRFLGDAEPMLAAGGYSHFVAGLYTTELGATHTLGGGALYANSAPDISCLTDGMFEAVLTRAPPAMINTLGARKLSFGQQCVTTPTDNSPNAIEMACITNNGWGFDVEIQGTSSLSPDVSRSAYDNISNDLEDEPLPD